MKTLILLLSCMLFTLTMSAQQPAGGSNPFLNEKTNTIDDLHAAIVKTPYTFHAGSYIMHLKFDSNGTGAEEDWKFKWHAKDAQTVELFLLDASGKPNGKKTTLTFNDDYSSYTGYHFDGTTAVAGTKVEKH